MNFCKFGLDRTFTHKAIRKMKLVFILVAVFYSTHLQAQFWFGPKGGIQFTKNVYDDKTTPQTYDIGSQLGWHAGISLDYQTEGLFAVHTEIMFEKIKNKTTNKEGNALLISESTYNFISAPMMLRAMFGFGQLKFYAQGGPRVKYWLGGNGSAKLDDLLPLAGVVYDVKFKNIIDRDVSNLQIAQIDGEDWLTNVEFIVENPNRLQYSIDIGGGVFFDISEEQRINFDLRYSFGHSNMGFNVFQGGLGLELSENEQVYVEDLEYHHNTLTLSVAYLFGYSPSMQKKGKSSIKRK